ncbi:MAG: acetylornithine aminotransferase [Elusimicrobia bacterium RIFOXYC2_FULL_34_12]|nr:MAG: acetylornithine aminotransferase [Elusimicrobia bacterium RIFOXYC2_FULL_34_12]OGS38431.1 MAG: acetylornithine aminotransferase [Elusimicrobia bacterium RIFOXYD2_FULL_34_30]HAM38183.1 aspartate aminotransferase family protein [Elusimicrobiota bacterium]
MSYLNSEKKYVFQTYKRYQILFVKGKGKYLWDDKGKKYLDFLSGISVCSTGHCNPKVVEAIQKQSGKLIHVSNLFYIKPQIELAKMLSNISFGGKVFFSNSGAEANECAIKLARKWGDGRYEIISFNNSFHGRTIATLSATGQKKFSKGFEPLLSGFKFADLNDISSVERLINNKTCAVIVEPIQGEGGVCLATKEFLTDLKRICKKNNILLIFDEIQCGLGRTGKIFAYKNYGIEPDIITLAKSLGGGLPIAATIAKKGIAEILSYGSHGSTFGGNPVCCAAALEVLKIVNNKKVLKNVEITGKYFLDKLNILQEKYNFIKEVRGLGFIIGIELNIDGKEIVKRCLQRGLIINCTQDKVLRFLPPLIINKKDVDAAISILEDSFIE